MSVTDYQRTYAMILADLLPATMVFGEDRGLLHVFGDAYPSFEEGVGAAASEDLQRALTPLLDTASSHGCAADRIVVHDPTANTARAVEVVVRLAPAEAGQSQLYVVGLSDPPSSRPSARLPPSRLATTAGAIARPDRRDRQAVLRSEPAARASDELSTEDPVTGLRSRRGAKRSLNEELQRARRLGTRLSAVLIDVADYPRIAQMHGRVAAQAVLRQAGMRIESVLRPVDTVARTGGKEFVAILLDTRRAEAHVVADRIRAVMQDTAFEVLGRQIETSADIGLAQIDEDTTTLEEVLTHARYDLVRSKRAHIDRNVSAQLPPVTIADVIIAQGGLRALALPIYELASEQIVGQELLIRGPSGPYERPDDLFRAGVEQNALSRLDLACLTACLEAATQLPPGQSAHVNVFPTTLMDAAIDQNPLLSGSLDLTGICVEISEQQLVGAPNYMQPLVERMRANGAAIALDDVGFMRSSLESLIVLEPDIIKIDRSVIRGLSAGPGPRRAVERLLTLARHTGSDVIAEGVETVQTRDLLREVGVQYAQGFLWGRPRPVLQS